MVCCFVKEHINKGRACSFMSFKCFWRASTMSSTLFGVGGRDMSHFLMDTPHIRIPLKVCQVFFFTSQSPCFCKSLWRFSSFNHTKVLPHILPNFPSVGVKKLLFGKEKKYSHAEVQCTSMNLFFCSSKQMPCVWHKWKQFHPLVSLGVNSVQTHQPLN